MSDGSAPLVPQKDSRFVLTISTIILFLIVFSTPPVIAQFNGSFEVQFDPSRGVYRVQKDLTVLPGEVWKIQAGTHLCFDPGVSLRVHGLLIVDGVPGSEVVFTACDSTLRWGGVIFEDSLAVDGRRSALRHAVVEYAQKLSEASDKFPGSAGGGIAVIRSDVEIYGSIIRHNIAKIGGGIYLGPDSDVSVERTAIYNNLAVGSAYIYTGGAGLYIHGARRARIFRCVVARNNKRDTPGLNEEGGGGVYVLSGPVEFAFNLVIGNYASKGAAMLVNTQPRYALEPRSFVANVFAYNYGSLNFEQVALQTRESYDLLFGVGEWDSNAGQYPFVVHVQRTKFVRLVAGGSLSFFQFLRDSLDDPLRMLLEDRADAVSISEITRAYDYVTLHGTALDYGPIELHSEDSTVGDYFDRLGVVFGAPDLSPSLRRFVSPPRDGSLSDDDRRRLGSLISVDRLRDSSSSAVVDPLIEIVFSEEDRRVSAIAAIKASFVSANSRQRLKEIVVPALVVTHSLAMRHVFFQIVDHFDPSPQIVGGLLDLGFAEAALSLLRTERYANSLTQSDFDSVLYWASRSGAIPVIKYLLSRGGDPDLAQLAHILGVMSKFRG